MDQFELAFLLHTDIQSIRDMDYTDYVSWHAYFEMRPVGWREDQRVMPLLQIKGVKAKAWELFPSLIPIMNPSMNVSLSDEGAISTDSLKKSPLFAMMAGAKGGDKLSFLEAE